MYFQHFHRFNWGKNTLKESAGRGWLCHLNPLQIVFLTFVPKSPQPTNVTCRVDRQTDPHTLNPISGFWNSMIKERSKQYEDVICYTQI